MSKTSPPSAPDPSRQPPHEGEIILYVTAGGTKSIEVLFEGETAWMSQKRLADLFGVDVRTVSEHLQNIFASGELQETGVLRKIRTTAADGKSYWVNFYNLDAIISVGYRVNSTQATQFRIWATQTLREFVIKGFVLDDERLKLNKRFGKDYFDELLERIREIRASERRFYLKITDIYEQCSIDYDKDAEISKTFFKTVQNKLHWAVTGQTAAEIIAKRADATKPSMGLTTWKNAPHGKILKSDVSHCQELPDRGGDQGPGADRHHVPRLRREPGRTTDPHANGRLGGQAGCVPEVQRIRRADQCRHRVRRSGQAIGRRAVRHVPYPTGPAV